MTNIEKFNEIFPDLETTMDSEDQIYYDKSKTLIQLDPTWCNSEYNQTISIDKEEMEVKG